IACGVYRHGEALKEQAFRSAVRRNAVIEEERENRHKVATCLWRLRMGSPVETTCRQNGWNPKSIWNFLKARKSYRRFKAQKVRRWPDKRSYGGYYSRTFPKETLFHHRIQAVLDQ